MPNPANAQLDAPLFAGGTRTPRGDAGTQIKLSSSRNYQSFDDRSYSLGEFGRAGKRAILPSVDEAAAQASRSADDHQEVLMEPDLAAIRPELTLNDEEYQELTIDAAAEEALKLAAEMADELKTAATDALDMFVRYTLCNLPLLVIGGPIL